MACLDLDTPSNGCLLCQYTDQEYLTNLYESLYGSTNVYHTMFNVFRERQKLLERQRLPFLKLDFSAFKHHFEHQDDIDTVRRMKEGLMKKMGTKNLTATEVNTFIKLSTHHVHLTSKMKSIPTTKLEPFKPYEFD